MALRWRRHRTGRVCVVRWARLQYSRKWPRWKVPNEMAERHPELAPYTVANGGWTRARGPAGARALYLFQNGADTLYRIHGGCEPQHWARPSPRAACGFSTRTPSTSTSGPSRVRRSALPSLNPTDIASLY